jgi:hypothetical protein
MLNKIEKDQFAKKLKFLLLRNSARFSGNYYNTYVLFLGGGGGCNAHDFLSLMRRVPPHLLCIVLSIFVGIVRSCNFYVLWIQNVGLRE